VTPEQDRPPLRLTDRGRHVLLAVVLAMALGTCALVGSVLADDPAGIHLAGESTVVVESGDTLWSIATSVADAEDDVRVVVDEIQRLNGLEGSDLVPGQVLQLP
jgi:nucleoid-associated protein YgaU